MRPTPSHLAGPARIAAAALALLLVAGCSDSAERGVAVVADDVARSTVVVDDTAAAAESTGPDTATTAEQTDGATGNGGDGGTTPGGQVLADGDLPGDAFDGFAHDGDEMTVVGVAHDDVLNVRSGPGTDFDIIDGLAPVGETVAATGRARLLSRSIWYEIDTGSVTGWVNAGYLAQPGVVDDVTAEVVDSLGSTPGPLGLEELGRLVAEDRSSTEPPSRISLAVAPSTGDPGEVTFDVLGLGDDAVLGLRLHVFASAGGGGWTLSSVEQTTLCGRGVDADGLCA